MYASNVDNPDVWRVYEEDGTRPDTCDFGDKIFIVEYRADEPPEAVCIEPRRPLSPVSTVEVELEGAGRGRAAAGPGVRARRLSGSVDVGAVAVVLDATTSS